MVSARSRSWLPFCAEGMRIGLLLLLRSSASDFHYFPLVSSEVYLAHSSFPVYRPKFCERASFPQSVLHVLSILLEHRSRSP
jgi:hypothetical protein